LFRLKGTLLKTSFQSFFYLLVKSFVNDLNEEEKNRKQFMARVGHQQTGGPVSDEKVLRKVINNSIKIPFLSAQN
jgi:DNA polymerase elongation subunit (family B)